MRFSEFAKGKLRVSGHANQTLGQQNRADVVGGTYATHTRDNEIEISREIEIEIEIAREIEIAMVTDLCRWECASGHVRRSDRAWLALDYPPHSRRLPKHESIRTSNKQGKHTHRFS